MNPLNHIELFLKEFLNHYPEYQTKIISNTMPSDYDHLMYLLEKEWTKKYPELPFFLAGSSPHLGEDFFISPSQNVSVIKNLRYFPFILHSHQFIEVNYVVCSDNSSIISENGTTSIEDGDIILCPPGFSHCFKTHNENSCIIDLFLRVTTFDTVFFNLLNNNNYLSALFSNALYNPSQGYIIWHCKNDTRLKDIVLSAYDESENNEKYSDKMLEILVMEFFLMLLRNHEQEAEFSVPYMNSSDEQFRTLLNYMHTHYQTVTLPKLAMQYNYSERQIIRVLKKHSGKNFSELLLEIRMNKALQLLKNPSITISEISTLLGYSSNSYFLKVFKKTFTFTPDDFRKRLEELNS